MDLERNRAVVRRFYDEVWNRWDAGAAEEIVAADIRFRGSLGTSVAGRDGFLGYVEQVRTAFPDFHNEVHELIAEGDTVVARLTCSGTHGGPLFGVPATGRRVAYAAIAILRLGDGLIEEAWVVGDTQEVWRAITSAGPEARSPGQVPGGPRGRGTP